MMKVKIAAAVLVIVLGTGWGAEAQVPMPQVLQAQAEMSERISRIVAAYATQIGLDESFVSYCQSELSLKVTVYPPNGLVPFGMNWRTIPDRQTLDWAISVREDYERNFIILCLANARNARREAERR
jgi:hypothetical protein